ncbi:hypothetical protein SPRG_20484 [Saprolegnia parasitica CBS 223.65]|uniref:Thioredoxin-like fold domain-containing protein n=1 Tax=Saprolegnia parasitica (strain CBS 223.65) TaxID=695850 RepID=A0A067CC19_SAPPC|nr:hypothetical protein SPRG_20484 [Saprolegnia parasitica CBS 223.65]KDO26685.1 hypothetical protein SPRG_20484 [Saprolegnia parasitica CBS 223.65]|eukprot:XP_012202578.1 hypothetical protein SPRG_20484 [Saprolegnia parasitica CBS 223.65]
MAWPRFALALWACAVALVAADVPTTTPGFVYKGGLATAPVQLEIFIDLLCPYSKAAYPAMKKLEAAFKGSDLRITFQVLPLPFHKHAFTVAQSAATLTHVLGIQTFPPWLETIYANQDRLYNAPTKDMTAVQVVDLLFDWASTAFPKLTKEAWSAQMTGHGGSDMDEKTRQLFRYSLAHGISGTPMFYLNGVHYDAADSSWSFEQWRKTIQALVDANTPATQHDVDTSAAMLMASSRRLPSRRVYHGDVTDGICDGAGHACEFFHQQTMCCSADEVCIVQHGCKAFA